MVGQEPLKLLILVRFQVPQQSWTLRAGLLELSLFFNGIYRFEPFAYRAHLF